MFVGLQVLGDAPRPGEAKARRSDAGPSRCIVPLVAFRQGVITNLANPKSALFFTSLRPQFVRPDHDSVLAFLLLGPIYCVLTLAWLTSYSVALAKVGDMLRQAKLRRALEGITGALMAFGVRIAVEHSGIR